MAFANHSCALQQMKLAIKGFTKPIYGVPNSLAVPYRSQKDDLLYLIFIILTYVPVMCVKAENSNLIKQPMNYYYKVTFLEAFEILFLHCMVATLMYFNRVVHSSNKTINTIN